ncbi:MAG: glycosyltransferase [Candidatus Promineifilaceae bacterium]
MQQSNGVVGSPAVGVVIIGRNEGKRLKDCIRSVLPQTSLIVYVDSGSTDDSVPLALTLGCSVVQLDMTRPFTAGRGRNAGYQHLLSQYPHIKYVQFIDGDCVLDKNWLKTALAHMTANQEVAVVCGRRRERFPDASVYNLLCDMEWDTPIGEAAACGGDSLMRVTALMPSGGFDPAFAAGEEPELCFRLRRAGWKIWRLDAEMTRHDASMTELGQWWQRSVRSGSAYAQGVWTHGRSDERYDLRDSLRIWLWAFFVPATLLGLAKRSRGVSLLGLAVYPFLAWRVYRYRIQCGDKPRNAAVYAAFNILGKFAQLVGQTKFFAKRQSQLIEYK